MKDVVVGCITKYTFDDIKCWVNSLDRCGFNGDKVMICYNIGYDVVKELKKRDYKVLGFIDNPEQKRLEYDDVDFNICLQRFYDIWAFFNNTLKDDYRYLIAADVKDVIFQTNPSEWLERNIGDKKINVGSESLHYRNEPWGRKNLKKSFGKAIYDMNCDNLIFNAGTVAGECKTMIDLFLNIYMFCGRSPVHIPGRSDTPDQAALNVLLNLQPYKAITNFTMSEDGYAAQLGTTANPEIIEYFKPFLVEKTPVMIDDLVCTSIGKPFCLVHQYDRVPEWKKILEEKYK